jgi:hypothetical protein
MTLNKSAASWWLSSEVVTISALAFSRKEKEAA